MRRAVTAAALVLGLLACRDSTGPLVTDVTGTWAGSPGLETGYQLSLTQSGSELSGTGTMFRNINPPTEALSVTGTVKAGHVTMRLLAIDWFLDFDGQIVSRNDSVMMTGTATYMVGSPGTITFVRQPAP